MTLSTWLRSITLFPLGPWASGAYWTLPVEMAFYCLVGLAIWRGWPLTKVALGLGFYSVAFWLVKLANLAMHFADFSGLENDPAYILQLHFGVFFAFGILLHARRHPWAATAFLAFGILEAAWRSHGSDLPIFWFWLAPLAFTIGTGAIILSVFWNTQVSRWLRYVPTRTLGLMTYPLYLLHTEIGIRLSGFWLPLAVSLVLALFVLPVENAVRGAVRRGLGGSHIRGRSTMYPVFRRP